MQLPPVLTNKKVLLAVSGSVALFLGVVFILSLNLKHSVISPLPKEQVLAKSITQESFPLPSAPADVKTLGILLLGYGGAGHDGGFLTDAIQVLFFDFPNQKTSLISIPRDLEVNLPNGEKGKINAVLNAAATDRKNLISSGAPTLKKLLTDITGLNLNYFIAVDFVGFQRSVGIVLNGLEVNVAQTLDDPWYPIKGKELETCGLTAEEIAQVSGNYSGFELERQFPCRYKQLLFKTGKNSMQGEQALEYVRSRHGSAEGDVSRGKRQQEVLHAVGEKLINLNILTNVPKFFEAAKNNVQTDFDLETVKYIAPLLLHASQFKIQTINLSSDNVLKIQGAGFIPKAGANNWDEIRQFITAEIHK